MTRSPGPSGSPQASNMGFDVLADVDAADSVAHAWTYDVKMILQTGRLARNRIRCRIAVLDEAPRILFPEPVLGVDLRVRFRKPLAAEVQSPALLSGLGAVDSSSR